MKDNVSNKIKFLNFMGAVIVLLTHFSSAEGFNLYSNKLINSYVSVLQYLCQIAMTMFFMTSAFLFYYNLKNSDDALKKMKKRLKTLLVPYIIWTIICWFFKFFILNDSTTHIISLQSFLRIIFFAPIDGPLWYILALLILMCVSPLTIKLKNKKLVSFVLFFCIVIFVYSINSNFVFQKFEMKRWWWYSNMCGYLPAYLVGAYFGLNFSDKILFEMYDKRKVFALGLILIVISTFLNQININIYYIHILEFIAVWLILDSNLFKKTYKIFNASFFIYASHQPVLIPLFKNLHHLIIGNHVIYDYQLILLKLISSAIMVLLVYFMLIILKKILPKKIYSMLSGGRT